MANVVKLEELSKVLKEFERVSKAALAQNDKVLTELVKKSTIIKNNLAGVNKKSAEGIAAVNKAEKEGQKIAQEREKTDQQRKKTLQELSKVEIQRKKILQEQQKLQQQVIRTQEAQARQTKRLTTEVDKQSKAAEFLSNKYKQLVKETREAKNSAKQLGAEYGITSKQFEKAAAKANVLDKRLKKLDSAVGDNFRSVGNYKKGLTGLVTTFARVTSALGIVAGFQLLRSVISDSIRIFKDFEQSNANLASILNKSRKEIIGLTSDAKRLGATTSFTASQVSELQTEFAKLGFNENEILDATEATLDLAAAIGSDLKDAAAIAGATLGGFGLDAKETQRVTDVMAKSFSISALDLEKFKESMKLAAPFAKNLSVSIEETTALLGTLSKAGISGSIAGTHLKIAFRELAASGLTLEQGLSKVVNTEDKLAAATELVGKNAAGSFLILADGIETTNEYTKSLNNAEGAAKQMADTQLDTLNGSIKILTSAWEGLILSVLSTDSAFGSIIRKFVDLTTAFIGFVTNAEKTSESLRRQQRELNGLVKAATAANQSEEIRLELIKKLQKEYPDFLANIEAEKITNQQLEVELQKVNERYLQRIKIQINQERLVEIETELLKIERARQVNLKILAKTEGKTGGDRRANINARKRFSKGEERINKLLEERNKLLEFNINLEGKSTEATKTKTRTGGVSDVSVTEDEETFTNRRSSIVQNNDLLKQQLVLQQELLEGKIDEREFNLLNQQIIQDQLRLDVQRLEGNLTFADDANDRAVIEGEILEKKREILAIEKRSNDAITDNLETEKETNEVISDRKKEIEELIAESVKLISSLTSSLFDKRKKELEEELRISLSNEEKLQKAKEAGSEDASKSLAEEEKRQREIEARQVKLEQRRLKTEAAIALLNAFAKTGNIGETVGALAVIQSAVSGLQGFHEGTDDTGNGNGTGLKDKHGNITGYTHKNEQVWSELDRADVGNRSRSEIKDIVRMADRGTMSVNQQGNLVINNNSNAELTQAVKEQTAAIKQMETSVSFNIDPQYINVTREKANVINKIKMRADG